MPAQADELPQYQTIDHARSVWTSPFTLPSRTIKNTYKNKRNWSTSLLVGMAGADSLTR